MILLTGATGYIGGRLLPLLESSGHPLRCLTRRPEHLRARAGPRTEIVHGDLLTGLGLEGALKGIRAAYYLVHALGSSGSFIEEDRRAATNFGRAARLAGIERIIYLGGLGDEKEGLSDHLRSRQETGRILRECGVPVLELRASIVIGSGSLSFEMVRALVERLPLMITPRWVYTIAQPIAVEDVIAYLLAAADLPLTGSEVFEIGGADQVSYGEIMKEYARQRGLKRVMISVPVLTPRLSGLWLGLVTPVYAKVGRQLVQGLKNPTVVRHDRAARAFRISPMGLRPAIARALLHEEKAFARTRWSDALSASGGRRSWGGIRFGARIIDSRTVQVPRPAAEVFAPIRRIGGRTGWYYADWLWRLRGALDLLVGGVGLRRGRRDPEVPVVGDTLDFWRVEVYEPDRRLRLAAEMKLPGRAWLEFEVAPAEGSADTGAGGASEAGCRLRQTAIFDPIGLGGLLYWYALYPLHQAIFAGMLRRIAAGAGRAGEGTGPSNRSCPANADCGIMLTRDLPGLYQGGAVKNFALVGTAGFVAPRHLKAIHDTGHRLTAACDPHDAVGVLDRLFPEARFFTEIERFDRFLEKRRRGPEEERIHYLSVCSPNYLHDAHIRLGLRAGAQVICEKPLVINPWNLDALETIEQETECRVATVLQLRLHPALAALREELRRQRNQARAEVELTYITRRGPWYDVSWKGSEEKSGGVAMNIGIHFFDLLLWLFGGVQSSAVHLRDPRRMAGLLELERARVRWFLSVEAADLPEDYLAAGRSALRSLVVNGQEIEFSEGFTDLHTRVYEAIMEGKGFGIKDARPSIELVYNIRHGKVVPDAGDGVSRRVRSRPL